MSDAFIIPLFVVALLAVFALAATFGHFQLQRRAKTLNLVAERFRGRLDQASIFLQPQIRLRFQDRPALLKYVQHGKHGIHTVFSITWPEPALRLEIYPQDILSGFRRLWGMEDIEIGSDEFDRAFYISGNSRQAVREMLSAEVQTCVWRLASMGWAPPIYASRDIQVQFLGGVLTITKPSNLTRFDDLVQFVTLSAELFEAAMRTRATGIQFVTTGSIEPQEPDAAQSQCQVCGESLADDLVWCAACKTPHHRECWEYFGGCSTYACGHKQYVRRMKRNTVK